MRICILSMQNVQNFGSLLQSYSLKKILEEKGHEVSFLPIEPKEEDNILLSRHQESYTFKHKGISKFIANIKKINKYSFNRFIMRKKAEKQDRIFNQFRTEVLKIKGGEASQQYDYCVIGSDEVFNCNARSPWGFTSQLFGNVKQATNVITYAASCGHTEISKVNEAVKNRIRESFSRIGSFSSRDENTRRFIEELTDKEIQSHFDPVVVGDFEKEIEEAVLPKNIPDRYCIVYSYYNRIHTDNEIKSIKLFCKAHNLEIIALGAPQMWIKKYIVCDPFQLLKLFQNASFVITDTFHGTIFSAKYARQFAVIVRPSNRNKLEDLICKLQLENHLINDMSRLNDVYEVYNDLVAVADLTESEKIRTNDYLLKSLL